MNKWPGFLLTTLGLAIFAASAQAELTAVDPGPYTTASGRYPLWYEDENNVKLELCRSTTPSPIGGAAGNMCNLLAEEGYDPSQPMVFPNNWPGELFWYMAETTVPGANGLEIESYTAAVEAAFSLDAPVDGDQISFARIRIRASVPTPGTYIVTHPYGVETLTVNTTGRRAINLTRDIGIGAPGNFTGALEGDVGPFLESVGGRVTVRDPVTQEDEIYISDPNVQTQVTGAPDGRNFVRIQGPLELGEGAPSFETNLFLLTGKVFDDRLPLEAEIDRATYRRTTTGTAVEVFARSDRNASLCFRETLPMVNDNPCAVTMLSDNDGRFFGRNPTSASVPPFVVVTARDTVGSKKTSSTSLAVTDLVKISGAVYSHAAKTLTITASSTDEIEVPILVAQGFGQLSRNGTTQTITVEELAQPPAFVTVRSAAGGSDTEMVKVIDSAPAQSDNELPVAQNDSASTTAGVPVTINLVANDSDPDGDEPLRVIDLTQPPQGQGSVALSGSTSVIYTPPADVTTALMATFSYRVEDARSGQSEPATVTVAVDANQAPVAVNDSVSNPGNVQTIDVLANDSDPEGNTPLTIDGLVQPAAGQGTVATDGAMVTYTPPADMTSAFTATFSYRARDSLGALSAPANVSVAVSPPPTTAENLTVTTASMIGSGDRYSWTFSGQTSLPAGNTISIEVSTVSGPVGLGTATLTQTGSWRLSTRTRGVLPSANPTATIRSAFGTIATVPLR